MVALPDKTRRAAPLSKSIGIILVDELPVLFVEVPARPGSTITSPVIGPMSRSPVVSMVLTLFFISVFLTLFTAGPVRLICEYRAR